MVGSDIYRDLDRTKKFCEIASAAEAIPLNNEIASSDALLAISRAAVYHHKNIWLRKLRFS